jgi:outer membrane protein assembly factor BamB
VILGTIVAVGYLLPFVLPDALVVAMLARFGGAIAILLWWLFFSRAAWLERLAAPLLMVLAVLAMFPLVHASIRGGHMGMTLPIYGTPVLALALVAWAVFTRSLGAGSRRIAMVAAMLLATGLFTLIRTDGVTGEGGSVFQWRWTKTAEERLLARGPDLVAAEPKPAPSAPPVAPTEPIAERPAADKPTAAAATAGKPADTPVASERTASRSDPPAKADVALAPAEWPGFRGPKRDGIVRGRRIETDWSTSPPVQMWRRAIGPGWSSFAVDGDLFYTQEQRGEHELVACYRVSTGEPVWQHRDAVRFWESNAGPGPRGTPTLHNGRVYAFGATGLLNALNARTGAVVWSRNVAADTGRRVPDWGFESSPLVVDDLVIVAASGTLAAYDLASGNKRWIGPSHGGSYSSPHLITVDGVPQIVQLSGVGATSVAPADGRVLWEHAWPGTTIVQPAVTANGDVLINAAGGTGGFGIRRLTVAQASTGWTTAERWTSIGLKPYFNDFVVSKGHAFGFDGSILSCIDLEDGSRKWKGGRYGNGQLVLLADQDALLVLSEDGELALVGATPDQFKELARFKAIEGKTWNHPALAGDVVLVRNGEEMAAFRLPLASR